MTKDEKRFCRREVINHWIANGYPLSYLIFKVRHFELLRYGHTLNIYSKPISDEDFNYIVANIDLNEGW